MLRIGISIIGTLFFSYAFGELVFGRKMEAGLLKIIVNLPFNDCIKECWRRSSCLSLNYNRLVKVCELNSVPLSPLANLEEDKKWIFYDVKMNNLDVDIGNCNAHTCLGDQICVSKVVGYDCVNEGRHPSSLHLEHGLVKGNMNDEGSKIAFECLSPYELYGPETATYLSVIGWSDMPVCEIVVTCSIPDFITSSFLQLLTAVMITKSGNTIYTKENVSSASQLGEVLENSYTILQCTTTLYGTTTTYIVCSDANWEFTPPCPQPVTSCQLETLCSNSLTESCISNVCHCEPPTMYSYTQHACVSSCQSGLASTFTRDEGLGVYNADYDYYSGITYNECLELCLQRQECLLFEYGEYFGTVGCYIRSLVLNNYMYDIGAWNEGAIYKRDCL